jgi:hypothetical protein
MKKLSRRNLIKTAGLMSAGCMVGFIAKPEIRNETDVEMPWQYYPVEPVKSAQIAYDNYPGKGCMYAVCYSILSQLGQKYGAPYNQFPLDMLSYGHGGVSGYGALCGALNGGALTIGLFCHERKVRDAMICNLYQWHDLNELPIFVPENSKFPEEIPVVASNSVICHVSVSKWCQTAMVGPDDPLRVERCRRLSSDVVIKVIELLDDYIQNEIKPFQLTAAEAKCMGCHGVEEAKTLKSNASMGCSSCHPNPHNNIKISP